MWTSIQAVNCTKYNTVIQLKSDSPMLPNLGKCQNSGGENPTRANSLQNA